MKRTCIQCNKEFELSQSEINFYKRKNLHIPKRCKECRELNRERKAECTEVQRPYVQPGKRKSPIVYCLLALLAILGIVIGSKLLSNNDNGLSTGKTSYETTDGQQSENAEAEDSCTQAGQSLYSTQIEKPQIKVSTVEVPVNKNLVRKFRTKEYLQEHFEKHGMEMGYDSAEEYLAAANRVISNEDALHKIEAEDGDDIYYLEATNEFVVVSTDGYIRTYFHPEDGIEYYYKQ